MKGEIEKIWKNETSDGRRYDVLQIAGGRYSLWEEDYLDKLQEGQTLEFDFRNSGEFKNISKIYEPAAANEQPGKESKEELTPEYSIVQKTRQIIRMSSLRSASRVLAGSKIPCSERADKTIEIAKKFEKYIDDEGFTEPDDAD
jgi:hypothetical protein